MSDAIARGMAAKAKALTGDVNKFKFNRDLSNGLTAVFNSGKLLGRKKSEFIFNGGSITLLDSMTSYIYVDYGDKSLHALADNIHEGGLFLGKVITANGQITTVDQPPIIDFKPSKLEKFKEKLFASYADYELAKPIGVNPTNGITEGYATQSAYTGNGVATVTNGIQKVELTSAPLQDSRFDLIRTVSPNGSKNVNVNITYRAKRTTAGNYNTELIIFAFAANGSVLNTIMAGGKTGMTANDDWVTETGTYALPDGTANIRIEMRGRSYNAAGALGYFEVKSLSVQGDNVDKKLKVAMLGDSLMDNGQWVKNVLDYSQKANGFNAPNVSIIQYDDYALGSQTSHYGAVMTAKPFYGLGGKYNDTNFKVDSLYSAMYETTPRVLREHDLMTKGYDLVVIAYGANGGTDQVMYTETIIKTLREKGIDVILGTQNPRSVDLEYISDVRKYMVQMAVKYGCTIMDSFSYVREAFQNGVAVHSDGLHMSPAGHLEYSKAFRSVLNDVLLPESTTKEDFQGRLYKPNKVNVPYMEIQTIPFSTTGTWVSSGFAIQKIMSTMFAGLDKTASKLQLETGQNAFFAHPHNRGFDLLYDMNDTFTAEIYRNNGGVLVGTITKTGLGYERLGLVEAYNRGGSSKSGSLASDTYEIRVTSGTMKILGAVFYTPKNEFIDTSKMFKKGSFGTSSGRYSVPNTTYTDTVNDSLTFEFIGLGCQVLLQSTSQAGIVDVYLDGKLMNTDLDLYSTGNYIKPVNLFVNELTDFEENDVRHVVKIILKGANASATATDATNHRLQCYGGTAFKRN